MCRTIGREFGRRVAERVSKRSVVSSKWKKEVNIHDIFSEKCSAIFVELTKAISSVEDGMLLKKCKNTVCILFET